MTGHLSTRLAAALCFALVATCPAAGLVQAQISADQTSDNEAATLWRAWRAPCRDPWLLIADPERAGVNPMALSGLALGGLALAGANRGLAGESGPGESDDGVLWALEAASLRLSGTELAALSACDAAKGVADPSEGVYGLGRAFQVAGADSDLLTLWTLNDAR